MTRVEDVERIVADWLQDGAYEAPDPPIEAAVAHARAHPRRRDLLALLRRDAMTNTRTILGLPPALAAILAILVVGGVTLAGGAFLRAVLPATPPPLPSASNLANASQPASSPTNVAATPSPVTASSAPFVRDPEPGSAIPAAMVGTWWDATSPAFVTIYMARTPYCLDTLSSDQDCLAWQLPDGETRFGGVLTMLNDKLAIRWLGGGGCRNLQSLYTATVTATTITLVDTRTGTCNSGDYHWVRAGQGAAPTAPPAPQP